jgi:outer membrane protein assembly factor BamB
MQPLILVLQVHSPVWTGGACDPARLRPGLGTIIPVPPRLAPNELSGRSDDPGPGVDVNYRTGRVTRRAPSGRLLWVAEMGANLGAHREPHVLHDAAHIYLSHGDGITALNVQTGKVAWHRQGPSDRLHLSGNLLLATDCRVHDDGDKAGRWLVARTAGTGAEVFKVALPVKDFDPWPIRELTGLFLVQASPGFAARGEALLIDRKGTVRFRFQHPVVDGRPLGEDRIFLTTHDLFRVDARGKRVWTIAFGRGDSDRSGGLRSAAGDLVVFRFGAIWDSGVQLMRVAPRTGERRWSAKCRSLGVSHSKYHHRADVAVDGQRLWVISRGSFGSFLEVLDLGTGKQLERRR